MTTKFLRLWFWGLHLVCQKSTLSFDMKIMTSCCWPCRALLREDQLKKRRFDVKTAFSMGTKNISPGKNVFYIVQYCIHETFGALRMLEGSAHNYVWHPTN
jgi:hypothetical protein